MSDRQTVVVLGTSLASQYHLLWQREQEFTTCLMRHANVLYVERAAGGAVTPSRIVGRVRKMMRHDLQGRVAKAPFPAPPAFVRWMQIPASGTLAWRASARNVLKAVARSCELLNWQAPSLIVCGSPTEVWRYALEEWGLPYWYDVRTRVFSSPLFATTDRAAMEWVAREATLMTADTQVCADDWRHVREDVIVVPQGAREWGAEPSFSVTRDRLYYVGSIHGSFDIPLVRGLVDALGQTVRVVAPEAGALGSAAEVVGWTAAGDLSVVLSDAVAGLVPYVVDEFGRGVYPTKIYDYLLAGAPVLATALPALDGHPYVTTCHGVEEFADGFAVARDLSTAERRNMRAWALEHGWSRRFEVVRAALATAVPDVLGARS